MDPISALGLASNIIQVVDFSTRIIARGHELYRSADGRTKEHAVLDSATASLSELYDSLGALRVSGVGNWTAADKQLVQLRKETKIAVRELRNALDEVALKIGHGNFQSIYQALKLIWNEAEINGLTTRLDSIRNQVDTVLLVSIREGIDKLAKGVTLGKVQSQAIDWDEATQRHNELLNAIRAKDWHANRPGDIDQFSKQLSSYTTLDLEKQWHKLILARLYFRHMPNRAESIPEAHSTTFEWLFKDDHRTNSQASWDSFTHWLQQDDNNLYWITGKPGSGKSTLMKFIYSHRQLPVHLRKWARGAQLVKAGFYFWNSGSTMQMSRVGLFQTLIHSCLQQHRDMIISALPERWEQFNAFGGGQETFDWQELRRVFKRITSDTSRRFLFVIDGLDEYDGDPKEIIDLIFDCMQPSVKLCVAGRPWLPFEDAFNKRPNLLLERLTQPDISKYVTARFRESVHYTRLKSSDPTAAESLLLEIVEKAHGVFLWVYLVVQSLADGLLNSDRMSDLQARLDELPSDLEALFDKILRRLEPKYFHQACETFRLVRSFRNTNVDTRGFNDNPTLLELYYADDDDTESGIKASDRRLAVSKAREFAENMRRRINARCKGFIEVQNSSNTRTYDRLVGYLHRSK